MQFALSEEIMTQIVYAMDKRETAGNVSNLLPGSPAEPKKLQTDNILISDVFLTGQSNNPVAILIISPNLGSDNQFAGWIGFEYDPGIRCP